MKNRRWKKRKQEGKKTASKNEDERFGTRRRNQYKKRGIEGSKKDKEREELKRTEEKRRGRETNLCKVSSGRFRVCRDDITERRKKMNLISTNGAALRPKKTQLHYWLQRDFFLAAAHRRLSLSLSFCVFSLPFFSFFVCIFSIHYLHCSIVFFSCIPLLPSFFVLYQKTRMEDINNRRIKNVLNLHIIRSPLALA